MATREDTHKAFDRLAVEMGGTVNHAAIDRAFDGAPDQAEVERIAAGLHSVIVERLPQGWRESTLLAMAAELLTREPVDGVCWLRPLGEGPMYDGQRVDEGAVAVRLRRAGLIGMDVHAYWLNDPPLGRAVAAALAAKAGAK